jgi:hypothetical protein
VEQRILGSGVNQQEDLGTAVVGSGFGRAAVAVERVRICVIRLRTNSSHRRARGRIDYAISTQKAWLSRKIRLSHA